MTYSFDRILNDSFAAVKEATIAALKEKGFGVLTEIDVQTTMKNKIDKDMAPYTILGACNPGFAWQALQAEPRIGTMLPCNVILRELPDGKVEVSAVDPMASMASVENETLGAVAKTVQQKLKTVVDSL